MTKHEPSRGAPLNSARRAGRIAVGLIVAWLGGVTLWAQAPNLGEGRELWRGEIEGHALRLLQIPRSGSALIPRRFLLEELAGPASAPPLLDRLARVEITAESGIEATRSYTPVSLPLHLWGDRLAEVRETFRAPGTYSLQFVHDDGRVLLRTLVEVAPYGYLSFGREMGFFVVGCGLLGVVMVLIIRSLHRRRQPLPAALGPAHPAPVP